MEIKLADFSHKPELIELWREAFGDSEKFIASFLDAYLMPEYNAPIFLADGKVVSAFYLVEFELYSHAGLLGSCAYLFAAATREKYRGRGYMTALMKYAAELYANRGVTAIFLFPQDRQEHLFSFYGRFGFESIYQARKVRGAKTGADLAGMRLVEHEINDVPVFDALYSAYVEFAARQALSPKKDRLFYFRCASGYLEGEGRHFAVFERGLGNNVEKFCYVFYKKFENNYYIDDIIMAEHLAGQDKFAEISALLADFLLSLGDDIRVEMLVLPEDFAEDNIRLGMLLPLDGRADAAVASLSAPVYLNMFMNM